MLYQKIPPPLSLRPFVECYYIWKQPRLASPLLVRSPPTGFAAMVFNLGLPYQNGQALNQIAEAPKVFLAGQATQGYFLRLQDSIDVVGVVFRPTGLYHLLQIPMGELTDLRLDASLIMDGEIMKLWEQLGSVQEKNCRIDLLNQMLEKRMIASSCPWDEVDAIVDRILLCNGIESLQHLLSDCSLSTRQFQRNFQKKVGVSPKFYCKLRRFSYICSLLIRQEIIDWHEIVYLGGYFDQSHFIKDFLAFMKENPSTYYHSPKELATLIESEG